MEMRALFIRSKECPYSFIERLCVSDKYLYYEQASEGILKIGVHFNCAQTPAKIGPSVDVIHKGPGIQLITTYGDSSFSPRKASTEVFKEA